MEGSFVHMMEMTPKRRRNREIKSCWPCRDRKVRCDMTMPCSTCKRRNHTDLCQYGPRPASSEKAPGDIAKTLKSFGEDRNKFIIYVPDPSSAKHGLSEDDLNVDDQSPDPLDTPSTIDPNLVPQNLAEGGVPLLPLLNNISNNLTESWETDKITKATTFLGRNSSPTFFRRLSSIHIYDLLPKDVSVESAFCLTNRTTLHPFGSLWVTVNVTLADILRALPEVETCMKYYRSFQHTVKPFYPFLLDPEAFERRFCEFLQVLGDSGLEHGLERLSHNNAFNDAAWYGLLFAVLASGCQYSDAEPRDRILRTRVFVVCAFECMRLANLYVLPSLEIIQCMLFIELTLANDCNPGVANSLLGLTVQQAQELGLHVRRERHSEVGPSRDEVHPLWRAIVFLDSIFSSAYDRKPITFLPLGCDIVHDPTHSTASSFDEIMWAIHALKLNWQKTSAENPTAVKHVESVEPYINALEQLDKAAEETFPALKPSVSIQGRLEELMYTMYLHSFKSKLVRSACLSRCPNASNRRAFFEHMNKSLREVVRAFLALKQLSFVAIISWDILHQAMTSALLLGGIETIMNLKESRELLQKLVKSLSNAAEVEEDNSEAAAMIAAPFRHGLDTVRYLLDKRKFNA